jgi:hypothetical protein
MRLAIPGHPPQGVTPAQHPFLLAVAWPAVGSGATTAGTLSGDDRPGVAAVRAHPGVGTLTSK